MESVPQCGLDVDISSVLLCQQGSRLEDAASSAGFDLPAESVRGAIFCSIKAGVYFL